MLASPQDDFISLPATMLPNVTGRRLLKRKSDTDTSAPIAMPIGTINMFATECCTQAACIASICAHGK